MSITLVQHLYLVFCNGLSFCRLFHQELTSLCSLQNTPHCAHIYWDFGSCVTIVTVFSEPVGCQRLRYEPATDKKSQQDIAYLD